MKHRQFSNLLLVGWEQPLQDNGQTYPTWYTDVDIRPGWLLYCAHYLILFLNKSESDNILMFLLYWYLILWGYHMSDTKLLYIP